jgi:hypothetical protein
MQSVITQKIQLSWYQYIFVGSKIYIASKNFTLYLQHNTSVLIIIARFIHFCLPFSHTRIINTDL